MELIKRKDAELLGLDYFYTGKVCKWGHTSARYARDGVLKYRGTNNYCAAGLCVECVLLMKEGNGKIGKSFEEIIDGWDSSHPEENTKRLPFLSGTSSMGYRVAGYTLIDSDWYKLCSKVMWIMVTGYVKFSLSKDNLNRLGKISLHGKTKLKIPLHRFVLGIGVDCTLIGDHINGNKLDNRLCNLRLATTKDNSHNSLKSKNSISKFIGVTYDKSRNITSKRWRVVLCRGSKRVNVSTYTEEESAILYDTLLRNTSMSEFNVYNFPEVGERGRDGVIRVT